MPEMYLNNYKSVFDPYCRENILSVSPAQGMIYSCSEEMYSLFSLKRSSDHLNTETGFTCYNHNFIQSQFETFMDCPL